MEIGTILGLPAHPLLVHAAVVLTPLAATGLALCAIWPAARRRFGWPAAGLAVVTAAILPFVTGSGEALKERVAGSALVERHEDLGEQLLPWTAALALLGVAVMFVHRRRERARDAAGDGNASAADGDTATGAETPTGLFAPTGPGTATATRTAPATATRTAPATATGRRTGGPVLVVLTVLLLAAAAGSTVQVARIGHSGAQAVWSDTASNGTTTAGTPDKD
jgi:uncharacterized membrane protein